VAVSHLAATPYRAKIKHHIRGRNCDFPATAITPSQRPWVAVFGIGTVDLTVFLA
jgi:hypothetical protein